MARSLDAQFITSSGPVLERPADLAGLLTRLQKGDVLFVDEVHRLRTNVEEFLYDALASGKKVVTRDELINHLVNNRVVITESTAGVLPKALRIFM